MRTSIQKTTLGYAYEFELIARGPGKVELVDRFGRVYYQQAWTDQGDTYQTGRMVDPDRRHGLEFKLTGREIPSVADTVLIVDDPVKGAPIDVTSTEVKGAIDADSSELG